MRVPKRFAWGPSFWQKRGDRGSHKLSYNCKNEERDCIAICLTVNANI